MIGGLPHCDWQACEAVKRDVNKWWVVLHDLYGVHVYEWEKCPAEAMKKGKHFCGIAHAIGYISKEMTPDETKADRESTLVLAPPLARDGSVPVVEEELNIEDEAAL